VSFSDPRLYHATSTTCESRRRFRKLGPWASLPELGRKVQEKELAALRSLDRWTNTSAEGACLCSGFTAMRCLPEINAQTQQTCVVIKHNQEEVYTFFRVTFRSPVSVQLF